jgi:hypothetical protein
MYHVMNGADDWYEGTVTAYTPATGMVTIEFDDPGEGTLRAPLPDDGIAIDGAVVRPRDQAGEGVGGAAGGRAARREDRDSDGGDSDYAPSGEASD